MLLLENIITLVIATRFGGRRQSWVDISFLADRTATHMPMRFSNCLHGLSHFIKEPAAAVNTYVATSDVVIKLINN